MVGVQRVQRVDQIQPAWVNAPLWCDDHRCVQWSGGPFAGIAGPGRQSGEAGIDVDAGQPVAEILQVGVKLPLLDVRGISVETLVAVTAVAVECTESWLLCGSWPIVDSACAGVEHPGPLGCENNKNRAKHVFDRFHGGGWQPRSKMAEHITRHPLATEYQRLRRAPDFRLLERKLEDALVRLV